MAELKTISVGEIMAVLPLVARRTIMDILNSSDSKYDQLAKMKVLLANYERELSTVELIPNYLAYVLVFVAADQARRDVARRN